MIKLKGTALTKLQVSNIVSALIYQLGRKTVDKEFTFQYAIGQ